MVQVGYVRVSTCVLALIVLAVGSYAHYNSGWKHGGQIDVTSLGIETNPIPIPPRHETCPQDHVEKSCPPLSLETIYITIIFVCFLASGIFAIASCVVDQENRTFQWIDMWYHVVAAVLLLIGAILFLTSAVMLNKLYTDEYEEEIMDLRTTLTETASFTVTTQPMLFKMKNAAVFLTVVESILFGLMAFAIKKDEEQPTMIAPAPPPAQGTGSSSSSISVMPPPRQNPSASFIAN